MGTATTTSSAASSGGYSRAKKRAHSAVTDDDIQRAVDIMITGGLAVQPNGPTKVTTYSYAKHAGIFVHETSQNGVEDGMRAAGRSYITSEAGNTAASGVVDGAQQAVTIAAEHEVARRGVDAANKNLGTQSEQAMEDTLGAVMANGSDALLTERDDE